MGEDGTDGVGGGEEVHVEADGPDGGAVLHGEGDDDGLERADEADEGGERQLRRVLLDGVRLEDEEGRPRERRDDDEHRAEEPVPAGDGGGGGGGASATPAPACRLHAICISGPLYSVISIAPATVTSVPAILAWHLTFFSSSFSILSNTMH